MLLLTIDTAGKHGTVAISHADADVRVLGVRHLEGRQYSAQLIPAVGSLLQELGMQKNNLQAIAVTSGPGSFTGLRVGLAGAKGLAEILGLPLTSISVLEAIANSASESRGQELRVTAAMDAGRQEAYVANCHLRPGDEVHILEQELVKQADLVSHAARFAGNRAVSPDAAVAGILNTGGVPCEAIAWPAPEVVGRLAVSHFRRGVTTPAAELDADYIRRSDAEIFSAPLL